MMADKSMAVSRSERRLADDDKLNNDAKHLEISDRFIPAKSSHTDGSPVDDFVSVGDSWLTFESTKLFAEPPN